MGEVYECLYAKRKRARTLCDTTTQKNFLNFCVDRRRVQTIGEPVWRCPLMINVSNHHISLISGCRGAISVADRAQYIKRIRNLALACATAWEEGERANTENAVKIEETAQ